MPMPAPSPHAGDLTGCEIGDYLVLRRLGSGGMADVYLAEQKSLSRQVALKVLHEILANDSSYIDRFHNEARAAAQLVHPNIVQIFEVGRAGGVHYIAQEYVAGKSLGELLKRQGTLEPRLVLDVMRQVAAALCRAAETGIVHRDIKPENLLLSHSGELKVADFGLARVKNAEGKTLTQVGVTMGTPLYMSPEQIEGRAVDARSDLYSLGVTCYHLLTGTPPYLADTALAVAMQHLKTPPEPLENARTDVPSRLARIIHQLMAKNPAHRFAAPVELLGELRSLAGEAAEQGWGEGLESWSLAELVAANEPQQEATSQLAALMKRSSQLDGQASRWLRRAVMVTGCLVAGAGLGVATRPQYLLGDAAPLSVEKAETAWGQIFRASRAPSEAAWLAVEANFPDEDAYVYAQAKQGLVRYYLYLSEEYDKALPVLRELETMSGQDDRQQWLHVFTEAALVVAHENLGHDRQARDVNSRLTSEEKDHLRRTDRRLYELLQTSQRRLAVGRDD